MNPTTDRLHSASLGAKRVHSQVEEYTWTFDVPPRSKLERNIKNLKYEGYKVRGLQFKTGFLSDVPHYWNAVFYPNQIKLKMDLQLADDFYKYNMRPSFLELISEGHIIARHNITFQRNVRPVPMKANCWNAHWINEDDSWDDTVDTIKMIFRVSRRGKLPQCYASPEPEESKVKQQSLCDFSHFFLSTDLSDVTIHCRNESFPGHRVLLTSCSPWFGRLLKPTTNGQEKDVAVIVNDMEPQVLRQVLQFIYCNHVDMMSTMSDINVNKLFEAAKRFKLAGLQALCEQKMAKQLTEENCLEMFITAQFLGAPLLKEMATAVMLKNSYKFTENKETFKVLLRVSPDLLHKLCLSEAISFF